MILHIGKLDKFIPPFVNLVEANFREDKHVFLLKGDFEKYPVEGRSSVYVEGRGLLGRFVAFIRLVVLLHVSRKVIIHGMFNEKMVRALALFPWILGKCYWFIWGGDLYRHQYHKGTRRALRNERRRRFVIQRVGHLVTYVKGDVELARKWYGATGKHHECLMYLSNVVELAPESAVFSAESGGDVNVLLGNSAAPSNNHIEAMEYLLPYRNSNMKVFAPLSYGNKDNARKVIAQGDEWFGEKFVPITEYVPFNEYLDFLNKIDIAVFNHGRQQAMGNTISLLGRGKTVFMRKDVSQWEFLSGLGVELKNVEAFSLDMISDEAREKNAKIIRGYFSKDRLIDQLSAIFEG